MSPARSPPDAAERPDSSPAAVTGRVGDASSARYAPAVRRRRRLLIGGLLASLVLVTGVAAVALGEEDRRYEAQKFSFAYPEDWRRVEGVRFPALEQVEPDTEAGDDVVGIDAESWVSVVVVDLPGPVDAAEVREALGPYRTAVEAIVANTPDARLLQELFVVEKGGMPGMRYRVAASSLEGNRVTDTVTILFSGSRQFVVTCQARPQHAVAVAEGCERVLGTLEREDG